MSKVELKVLVDNNTIIDRYYLGEPAVSYLIKDGTHKVLFDVGYSDIFIKNAQQMGETLADIDYVVISHGHNDHTGGLLPLTKLLESQGNGHKPTLIAHPEAFNHKEYESESIGATLSREELAKHFDLKLSREPVWVTENMLFLGEVARSNDFENTEPVGKCECSGALIDDFVKDDSALAIKLPDGIAIVTGCSHAGICNIIDQAKTLIDEDRVIDVIGGFHLIEPTEHQAVGTLEYFTQQNIDVIHPCHCTSLKYKIALAKHSKVEDVGVGLHLNWAAV
ncbi:MBL fold metallo-hydrolase [Vibrio tubiashii]|uniref:MBL fold metallo-hydrolase n=1 Tax=Vibrio tubiashii TaxID=29498 RepID=UPI001EFC74E4|nr:MBL fold metallo-hydrolase [Vibrio tubiashii]MCG9688751.1 MBL fold metallo-hydrolase [Vibrio tubiashii]